MDGYTYRGDRGTMTEAEVQERIAAARAKARAEMTHCAECGYLPVWCRCPDGPVGGA